MKYTFCFEIAAKDFLSHGGMKRRYGSEDCVLGMINHVDNVSLPIIVGMCMFNCGNAEKNEKKAWP